MKQHLNIYKTFDVVVVPFPFVDTFASKNRPALVLSSSSHYNSVTGHTILAMITSALHTPWESDIRIKNIKSCGLEKPSAVRFKLFSIDNRLIKTQIGKLSAADKEAIQATISLLFNDLILMQ